MVVTEWKVPTGHKNCECEYYMTNKICIHIKYIQKQNNLNSYTFYKINLYKHPK